MATEKQAGRSGVIVTPVMRASFPRLDRPATEGQFASGKYELTLLLPKDRGAELKPLQETVLKTAREVWPQIKWAEIHHPFKDGDEISSEKLKSSYGNHLYFTTKTKNKPGLCGPDKKPLPDGVVVYGGCWVRASLVAKTYERPIEIVVVDKAGKEKKEKRVEKGVTLYLQNVMFVRDDEKFGMGSSPETDFSDIEPEDFGEVGGVDEDDDGEDMPF